MNMVPRSVTQADILIVDDTPDNIRLLSKMLQEQGYSVRKALNGHMALTAAQTLPPDLILLDINMPELDGYQVCQALKENAKTCAIPVIFLSALDDALDKVRAFQVGGVDYISKPFQFEEVLVRIQNHLMIKQLQSQLQTRNTELQHALTELKAAQAQLVQKEKMSSLGQLVAGIAHELNNPISFIYCNLSPARRYVQDLLKIVSLYQQAYPQPIASIQAAIQETDLNFLLSDLGKLMDSMQTGADRIRSVILALRIFSHLGEADIKPVDLHEGIESTLLLLQHRFKSAANLEINVVREYSKLPLVTCHASQLNQVFLNLLTNAIDALEVGVAGESAQFSSPTIWIRTAAKPPNLVTISIKDNGPGISEEVRSRLFEPFFTTKPVGKGTGLGLSMSYQIVVEKHRGQLMCHSSPQQGAEFIVEIPVQPTFLLEKNSLSSPVSQLQIDG